MSLGDWLARIPLPGRIGERPVVAVVRLDGVIGSVPPLRRGLSLASVAPSIERAFSLRGLKAVALAVNSPGGSAVQAGLIAGRIRDLAREKAIPVLAFAEDVAASGGYWLLAAADDIYADENSIVGSIGVVSAGFGFAPLLKRFGIKRRLYVAGKRKTLLDPFLAENADDVERLRRIQRQVHDTFKRYVRERRGARLKAAEDELFSGEFWAGQRAVELGLVDGIGDMRTVLRARFGENVVFRWIGGPRSWRHRFGFPGSERSAFADELLAQVEERLTWGRFGL